MEWLLVAAGALLGLTMLAFAGYAWARRDGLARFLAFLTLAWVALLALLLLAADRRGGSATELVFLSLIPAALLVPGTYLLFGQGRWIQARRLFGRLGTGLGAMLGLVALSMVVLIPAYNNFMTPSAPSAGRSRQRQSRDAGRRARC